MIWDVCVCTILSIAVCSGLWTMQVNHEYFSDFTVRDLRRGRIDGWLYVLNLLSTAWCLVDLVLLWSWSSEGGWSGLSNRWQTLWVFQHAAAALLAALLHILTYRLLSCDKFCGLCRREWGDDDHAG